MGKGQTRRNRVLPFLEALLALWSGGQIPSSSHHRVDTREGAVPSSNPPGIELHRLEVLDEIYNVTFTFYLTRKVEDPLVLFGKKSKPENILQVYVKIII